MKYNKTRYFCIHLYHNTPSHNVIHVWYKSLTTLYCDFLLPSHPLSYCRSSSRNCSEINVFLKPKISQETGKAVWYSHLFKMFLKFIVIHTKTLAWSIKQMFFWNSFAFLMIQQMLHISTLIPLHFLNPA